MEYVLKCVLSRILALILADILLPYLAILGMYWLHVFCVALLPASHTSTPCTPMPAQMEPVELQLCLRWLHYRDSSSPIAADVKSISDQYIVLETAAYFQSQHLLITKFSR